MDGGLNPVQEEFLRLMRAISDSLERESELQRQLRRTKESLVSVALQLQVAVKLSQEDEVTMTKLLTQAEESKAKELVAKSKAEDATSIVNQLNLELTALKRRLATVESEKAAQDSNLSSLQQQMTSTDDADEEVDAMFKQEVKVQIPKDISNKVLQDATPFERWKMSQFLYSSDTPAGSVHHDSHVVDMLIDAASAHLHDSLRRPTASYVAKTKNGVPTGANNLEDYPDDPISPLSATSPMRRKDRDYFLQDGVEQTWGARSRLAPAPMGGVRAGNRVVTMSQGANVPRKKTIRLDALHDITRADLPALTHHEQTGGRRPSTIHKMSI